MFIQADNIMSILEMYRLIWISGRFGGHKTALSFKIAQIFLERGYNLITNTRTIWADDIKEIKLNEHNQLKSVILLDEGGMYFKASRQIEQIAGYAAKMDCIYIIPSFWPPAKAAQIINIQPVISLKAAGIPLILYKWRVDLGQTKERGMFGWWNPQETYGVYSRQDPGCEPEDIIDFLVQKSDEYRTAYGRKTRNEIFNLEVVSEGDKILEAAQIMAESQSDIATVFKGKNRKR